MSSPSSFALLFESALRHGVVEVFREVAEEYAFDRARGVRTSGRVPVEKLIERAAPVLPDISEYQPVPVRLFRSALAHLPEDVRGGFVDLGCGKGRALILAAEAGFRRLRGIELSTHLACVAEVNLERIAARLGVPLDWRIEVGDATERSFGGDETTVFLFHPFGRLGLRRVLAHLRESLREHPRPLALVYVNPEHREVIADTGLFEELALGRSRIEGVHDWAVYVARSRPPELKGGAAARGNRRRPGS